MKNLILTLTIAVILAGCGKEPVSKASTDNPEITINTLFKHEGCTVYRFYDHGYPHYFVRCHQEQMTIGTRTESCGKGCTRKRQEIIKTE